MLGALDKLDKDIFLFLNGLHNNSFDFIMFWASNKFIWIPLYALILFWMIRFYRNKSWILILAAAVLVLLTDQTSVHLFKNVFMRLRPCHDPEIADLVHLVNNKCGGQYGFISSHATNVFGVAVFAVVLLGKKFKYFTLLILLWATFVSYSRIYLGVHYPGDVIVGAVWGTLLGYIIARFANRLTKFSGLQHG